MWKASAMRASEWARKPVTSSSKKKAVSRAIITLIRVLLDQASFCRRPMVKELRRRKRRGQKRCDQRLAIGEGIDKGEEKMLVRGKRGRSRGKSEE